MASQEEQKLQQKNLWSGAALDWEKWDHWFHEQTASLTNWLCDEAGVTSGMIVLDLACGTGQPAFTAAERALPGGGVVASDIAPEMIAAAERLGKTMGLENIEYREIDIENIPYPDDTFDAVTCRFGLMFCPDPVKGASEIRRVLKPGGRFALAVWDQPEKNEQFTSFLGPVAEISPSARPDPKAPGLFRLAAPGELQSVLEQAGFTEMEVSSFPSEWEYASPENYWEIMLELAAPLKAAAATLQPETLSRLRETVIGSLRSRHGDGAVRLKATPLCASGKK